MWESSAHSGWLENRVQDGDMKMWQEVKSKKQERTDHRDPTCHAK